MLGLTDGERIANAINDLNESNMANATSKVISANITAESIEKAGETISSGIIEAGKTMADATINSNMTIASTILSGTHVIATGLEKISSEFERQTKFKELSSLKDRIGEDENWLYEHKILKKFYEEVNLKVKYTSAIEPNIEAIPFLATICQSRHKDIFADFFINKEDAYNWETILQEYCLSQKCEPIHYIIDLLSKNGVMFCEAENYKGCYVQRPFYMPVFSKAYHMGFDIDDLGTAYIVGTGYSLKTIGRPALWFDNYEVIGRVEIPVEDEKFPQFNSITKTAMKSTLTQEKAEEVIAQLISLCKEDTICERDRLSWINFYHKLNSEIAFDNLRILANELEIYVRNSKIQL